MEWIIIIHAMVGRKLSSLLQIPHDSLICGVVLLSMLLQVLLIFVGGLRYRFTKSILSFVAWISYLSADYVAVYALGLMLHSSLREIGILYAVWAPLLLVHLGGPDTITAYSMIDNELWKRHALVMFNHLFVAAYLICVSVLPLPLEGKAERSLSVAAILIYLAGATKYFERTMALRFASIPQIVSSTLPIHTFMKMGYEINEDEKEYKYFEEKENEYNYIVSGEKKFFHEYSTKVHSFENSEENFPKKNFLKENFSKQNLKKMGVVTVGDVWISEGGKATEDYMLCVSHALFKSYMRRFGSLPFLEGNRNNSRKFFYNHLVAENREKVFEVVERELRFTYDYLFSKSSRTAFSILGTAMRLLNTFLLAVAFFQIFNTLALLEKQHGHNNRAERVVTYILLYVAVVLEMFQLCRIMLSDWTRVWLVCAHVRHADTYMAMPIKSALLVAIYVHKLFVLGQKQNYWQNQIQQYSLTGTCLASSACIEKVRCLNCTSTRKRKGRKSTPAILRLYIKAVAAWNMKPKPIDKELKVFILGKIKKYCYPSKPENYPPNLPSRLLFSIKKEIYSQVGLELNTETWEREILVWHVATAICLELDSDAGSDHPDPSVGCGLGFLIKNVKGALNFLNCKRNSGDQHAVPDDDPVKKNMRVSETLSNYCGYLLVSYPSILPLHPDMAMLEHEKFLLEIVPLVRDMKKEKAEEAKFWEKLKQHKDGSESIRKAAYLATTLLDRERGKRWELISQLWSAFVLYYAYFYKATFHGGSLAAGGEYLSNLWALLAHLGFGEQSDMAVGHRGSESYKDKHPAPAQQSEPQTVKPEAAGEIEEEKEEREIEKVGVEEIAGIGPASAQPPDLEKGYIRAQAQQTPEKQ